MQELKTVPDWQYRSFSHRKFASWLKGKFPYNEQAVQHLSLYLYWSTPRIDREAIHMQKIDPRKDGAILFT